MPYKCHTNTILIPYYTNITPHCVSGLHFIAAKRVAQKDLSKTVLGTHCQSTGKPLHYIYILLVWPVYSNSMDPLPEYRQATALHTHTISMTCL